MGNDEQDVRLQQDLDIKWHTMNRRPMGCVCALFRGSGPSFVGEGYFAVPLHVLVLHADLV